MSIAPRRTATRRGTRSRFARLLGPIAPTLLFAACAAPPAERLPMGTLLAGDAQQAVLLLQGLEQLRGTPLGLVAADLRRRLAGCRGFVAFCPAEGGSCTLAGSVRCEPRDELAVLADEARGDAGWLLVQRTPDRLLVARGTTHANGDVAVRASVRVAPSADLWQVLLPARRGPDPPVLSDASALIHLRLRSDHGGVVLGQLGEGDWAERLFGLRQQVFLAMDLEGTVEVAMFDPATGELVPPLAAAIHVRRRGPAVEAMEALIADVRARWGAGRRPWRFGTAAGACLDNLNVLPQLAPCYVATERALVVGWNRRSIAAALGAAPTAAPTATSEIVLALDRFPAADRRLRASFHRPEEAEGRYAWSRLEVRGVRRWNRYAIDLGLRAGAGGGAGTRR
jgi:hypothetical protein